MDRISNSPTSYPHPNLQPAPFVDNQSQASIGESSGGPSCESRRVSLLNVSSVENVLPEPLSAVASNGVKGVVFIFALEKGLSSLNILLETWDWRVGGVKHRRRFAWFKLKATNFWRPMLSNMRGGEEPAKNTGEASDLVGERLNGRRETSLWLCVEFFFMHSHKGVPPRFFRCSVVFGFNLNSGWGLIFLFVKSCGQWFLLYSQGSLFCINILKISSPFPPIVIIM